MTDTDPDAHDVAIPVATANLAAEQAHQRAAELAARDQIALFWQTPLIESVLSKSYAVER